MTDLLDAYAVISQAIYRMKDDLELQDAERQLLNLVEKTQQCRRLLRDQDGGPSSHEDVAT